MKIFFTAIRLTRFKILLCAAWLLVFAGVAFAQKQVITGTVTDLKSGVFLSGVNVLIKGTNTGTVTNQAGRYSVEFAGGNGTLVFSFIGYVSREVSINNQSVINLTLEEGAKNLDQVVVVGYGTQKKRDFSGSVASVQMDEKATLPNLNLFQALSGAAPTGYAGYDIWRSDWSNDIRNAEHNIKRNFYYDNPASKFDKKKIDFSLYPPGSRDRLRDTCQYIYPYFMKFVDPVHHFTTPAQAGGGSHHKDLYAIRLAETILLRAEAYVGLGNKVLAAADVNAIRTRSKATPVDPANVDLNYILDERARELYGEEWRHITLRRMGKLVERVRRYNNNPKNPGLNIQDYNVLFPIPQAQIDLNISAVMQQNPGY